MKFHKRSSASDLFETLIHFQIEPINDHLFATTSNDNIVKMWTLPDVFTIRQYGSREYVYSLLYDQKQSMLLVGNGAGDIEILNRQFELQKKIKLHTDLITCAKKVPKNQNLLATCSTDSIVKISKIYTQQILIQVEMDEPLWNFVFHQDKIYLPLIIQSKMISNFDSEPIVSNVEGKHRQMVVISGQNSRLISSNIGFTNVVDVETKQSLNVAADKISQYDGKIVVINTGYIGLYVKDKWVLTRSPLAGNYTPFCLKQVGQYLVLASDCGYMMVYQQLE